MILDRSEVIRSMLWYYLSIMLWHEEPVTWQVCRRFVKGKIYPTKCSIPEKNKRKALLKRTMFIIARTWKQPRCPSADEWIRKLWYIYTMEYYSAIKKNTFESVLMRWMKLEPIIQNEVSQKEKHQYSILMLIYGI